MLKTGTISVTLQLHKVGISAWAPRSHFNLRHFDSPNSSGCWSEALFLLTFFLYKCSHTTLKELEGLTNFLVLEDVAKIEFTKIYFLFAKVYFS